MDAKGVGVAQPRSEADRAERAAGPETVPGGVVGEPYPHDSAHLHVTGKALYCDDIALPPSTLHAAFGTSRIAHGRIRELDLAAVIATPGVVAVALPEDIPGENNYGGVVHDDPIFADGPVQYAGQPLFAVAATSSATARKAARRARITYDELPAILDIRSALAAQSYVVPSRRLRARHTGDGTGRLCAPPAGNRCHRRPGSLLPRRPDRHSNSAGRRRDADPQLDAAPDGSAAHRCPRPGRARALRHRPVPAHGRWIRRQGESAGLIAAAAALLALKTGHPVKLRLDRDIDMIMTGKRHDFLADYDVGFDAQGRILALTIMLASRCGYSADLSGPVNDRAVYHLDNAYFLRACRDHLAPLQDPHGLQHRLSRLRRPAGHDGDRADPR